MEVVNDLSLSAQLINLKIAIVTVLGVHSFNNAVLNPPHFQYFSLVCFPLFVVICLFHAAKVPTPSLGT